MIAPESVSETPGTDSASAVSSVDAGLPVVCKMRSPEIVYESVVCAGWNTDEGERPVTRPMTAWTFDNVSDPKLTVWSPSIVMPLKTRVSNPLYDAETV